ncbi:MAG: hypothetical protein AB7I18_04090 [Candidatus Berkiella sp.]
MLQMHPLIFTELKKCLDIVLLETSRFNPHLVPDSYRFVTRGLLAELNGQLENAKQLYLQSIHPIAFQRYHTLNSVTQHYPLPRPVVEFSGSYRPIHFYYKPAVVNTTATPVTAPKVVPQEQRLTPTSNKQLKFIPYNPKPNGSLSSGEEKLLLKLHELNQANRTKPSFATVARSLKRVESSIIDMYVDLYDRKILGKWPKLTKLGQTIVDELISKNAQVKQTEPKRDYRMGFKHILN